jgi:hypothetical protein
MVATAILAGWVVNPKSGQPGWLSLLLDAEVATGVHCTFLTLKADGFFGNGELAD